MLTRTSKKLLSGITIFTTIISLSACSKKGPSGPPQSGPPEVGVITVKQEKVTLTTDLPGRVSASMIAEVRPQVGGIIQKRLFTEGSDVKAGEVLYQIDPASYKAAYASTKALLSKADANITSVRLKSERYQELVKIKAVSQQEADDTFSSYKQAEAEVESAKAAVETARINLAYTRITAPVSGRIGRSTVTDGALVTASQTTALATIQQLNSVYVDVTQSSADMLKMKRSLVNGQMKKGNSSQAKVKLFFEDNSTYPLPGSLKFSEVTVDQSTGSITLRAVFPNPKQALLPGMFVRAVLEEGVNEQAILIPQRGVTRNPKGDATVMVVGTDEKVEPRIIKVDRTVGENWLVTDGLKPGDRVILEGLQKARPGTSVKAVPFGSAPPAAAATAPQPAPAKK